MIHRSVTIAISKDNRKNEEKYIISAVLRNGVPKKSDTAENEKVNIKGRTLIAA